MNIERCLIEDGSMTEVTIALITISFMFFERWLGRTNKVKQSSTIDLVAALIVAIVFAFVNRMKRKKGTEDGKGI